MLNADQLPRPVPPVQRQGTNQLQHVHAHFRTNLKLCLYRVTIAMQHMPGIVVSPELYTFFRSDSGVLPAKLRSSSDQQGDFRGGGLDNITSSVGRDAVASPTRLWVHGSWPAVAIRAPTPPHDVAALHTQTPRLSWARVGVHRGPGRARMHYIGNIWLLERVSSTLARFSIESAWVRYRLDAEAKCNRVGGWRGREQRSLQRPAHQPLGRCRRCR